MANLLINLMLYIYHIYQKKRDFWLFLKKQYTKSAKNSAIHNNY